MTLPNRVGYVVVDKKKNSSPTTFSSNYISHHLPTSIDTIPNQFFPFFDHSENLIQDIPISTQFSNVYSPQINYKKISENLTFEELQSRKNFVRCHRFLPILMELIAYYKKECILPSINIFHDNVPPACNTDFGLDDFLMSQGIDTSPLNSEDLQKNKEREEFLIKLEQLKEKYKEELEKLNKVCEDFCNKMMNLLREQSNIRPILEQETHLKMSVIQHKFDYVRNQLKQNVCNAILILQKQYNQQTKKKRVLPKKATEGLSQWFYEHISDPYPSEEEKIMLAAGGGLTITQVNNWFGNKRIRYKRKCLEEERKRARLERNFQEGLLNNNNNNNNTNDFIEPTNVHYKYPNKKTNRKYDINAFHLHPLEENLIYHTPIEKEI